MQWEFALLQLCQAANYNFVIATQVLVLEFGGSARALATFSMAFWTLASRAVIAPAVDSWASARAWLVGSLTHSLASIAGLAFAAADVFQYRGGGEMDDRIAWLTLAGSSLVVSSVALDCTLMKISVALRQRFSSTEFVGRAQFAKNCGMFLSSVLLVQLASNLLPYWFTGDYSHGLLSYQQLCVGLALLTCIALVTAVRCTDPCLEMGCTGANLWKAYAKAIPTPMLKRYLLFASTKWAILGPIWRLVTLRLRSHGISASALSFYVYGVAPLTFLVIPLAQRMVRYHSSLGAEWWAVLVRGFAEAVVAILLLNAEPWLGPGLTFHCVLLLFYVLTGSAKTVIDLSSTCTLRDAVLPCAAAASASLFTSAMDLGGAVGSYAALRAGSYFTDKICKDEACSLHDLTLHRKAFATIAAACTLLWCIWLLSFRRLWTSTRRITTDLHTV